MLTGMFHSHHWKELMWCLGKLSGHQPHRTNNWAAEGRSDQPPKPLHCLLGQPVFPGKEGLLRVLSIPLFIVKEINGLFSAHRKSLECSAASMSANIAGPETSSH